MKYLKTYNESLRDKMQPKSDEEIWNSLIKLSPEEMLIQSAANNYIKGVKYCLNLNVDPSYNNNLALEEAELNNNYEIIKLLLNDKKIDLSNFNMLDLLIKLINYHDENDIYDIVKLFLKNNTFNPTDYIMDYDAEITPIFMAYSRKKYKILELLFNDSRVKKSLTKYELIQYNKILSKK